MKIMVVSHRKALKENIIGWLEAIEGGDFHIISAGHEDAVVMFETERPDTVLICECDETASSRGKEDIGIKTYDEIRGLAGEEIRIIRIGVSKHPQGDYIKTPLKISELVAIISSPIETTGQ